MTDNQDLIAEVLQAEEALATAHQQLDLDAFARLLHPDYAIIQPGGRIESKADTLASLRAGGRYWEIARSDQLEVRLYGRTAVVIGRWRGKGQNGPQAFDYSARFLAVWVKGPAGWQMVASQATDLGEAG